MKKLISIGVVLALLCSGMTAFADGGPGNVQHGGPGGGMRGGNGGVDKSADSELQTMINEVAPQFQLKTYEENGETLQYYLYVPTDYDTGNSYPLIQFIPDSSVVGKEAEAVLTQGWGGLIWATEAEQTKHPAFVVVPVFTETIVDDNHNHSSQIDLAMHMLENLTQEYSIDTNRIYTTGQSMGGMTSFYLSTAYPDVFAAYLFVGSQWDVNVLTGLEEESFFYIVSAGDPKASAGQAELLEKFDADGAVYSKAEWSAQAENQDELVTAMLAEGNSANFVTFAEGTTLAEGQSAMPGAGEHMTSFDYAYKIEAVRDWLFAQTK